MMPAQRDAGRTNSDSLLQRTRALIAGFVTVTVALLTIGVPPAAAAAPESSSGTAQKRPTPIQVFRTLPCFSAATHARKTITFDSLAPGTSLGNPVTIGRVTFQHSTAASFKAIDFQFTPVTPPLVLAAFDADNVFSNGDTYLRFDRPTQAAGLYLIIGETTATLTATVIATDVKNHRLSVPVTFRGDVPGGEQQFIGFASRSKLTTISFGWATNSDFSTVVGMDDVVVK